MVRPLCVRARRSGRRSAKLAFALVSVLLATSQSAVAQLRIVTYNDSGENAAAGSGLATVFKAIGDEQRAGIKRPLDILSLQEQNVTKTSDFSAPLASTQNVVNLLNGLYGAGTYASSTIVGGGDSTQTVVYNTRTVQLVAQQAFLSTGSSGAARQPVRYQFRPIGYSSTADFYVYGLHPKASNDSVSAARRGVEGAGVRADADTLGTGARAIFTGDFNVYTSSEAFYQNMTAAGGAGQAFDPISRAGNWSNNANFADVHTQSPVISGSAYYGGQVGGGMDDRFDFQLVTAPVLSGRGLSYITNTYHAFGNAGVQFNNDINVSAAVGILAPYFPGYTNAQVLDVLNALAASSDHIPVVADYRLPAKMSVATTAGSLPGRVITGTNLSVDATIGNTVAAVSTTTGDQLDYTTTLSTAPADGSAAAVVAAQSGTVLATATAQTKSFTLDTTTPGSRAATLSVTTSSPGATDPSSSAGLSYTVLAHATPSLAASSETTRGSLDLGIVAIGGTLDASLPIYNLADVSGFTASLNITGGAIAGDAAIAVGSTTLANIAAGSAQSLGLAFTPTTFGTAVSNLTLNTFDESLPGAEARSDLDIAIVAFGAYAGDADLNNVIDFADLLALAKNYGLASGTTWQQGDFDRDGSVSFADLLSLAKRYGYDGASTSRIHADAFAADWALAQSLVPEPISLAALVPLALVRWRRRS